MRGSDKKDKKMISPSTISRSAYELPKELFPLLKGLNVQWPDFCGYTNVAPNMDACEAYDEQLAEATPDHMHFGHDDSCAFPDLAAYCHTCAILMWQCTVLRIELAKVITLLRGVTSTLADTKKLAGDTAGLDKLEHSCTMLERDYSYADELFQKIVESFPISLAPEKHRKIIKLLSSVIGRCDSGCLPLSQFDQGSIKEVKIGDLIDLTKQVIAGSDDYNKIKSAYDQILQTFIVINSLVDSSYQQARRAVEQIIEKHFSFGNVRELIVAPPRTVIARALKDAVEDLPGYTMRSQEET